MPAAASPHTTHRKKKGATHTAGAAPEPVPLLLQMAKESLRTRDEMRAYMEKHDLRAVLMRAVQHVVTAQPADPVAMVVQVI